MTEFEKRLHSMFDHIWECEIDHPVFQDTVGELMSAVIQCYNNLPSAQPKSCEDAVSRKKVFEYFVSLWECIGAIMDRDEWEDVCKTTANELPSVQPSFPQRHENDHIAEVSKMDWISRQGAIDAIMGQSPEPHYPSWYAEQIKNLPSVKPEQSEFEDITFWEKRAREYEEMVLKLTDEMARGIKIDSVLITEEGIVFKKEKPEQRWIPCKERLPEKEERAYWVCLEDGSQCQCRWTSSTYGFGAVRWSWHVMDKPQYTKIVAWRELPEPWKEGEEG